MGNSCRNYDFTGTDSKSTFLYCPNFGAALFFTVVFGLSCTAHIFQAFYYKKFRLCWVIVLGASWETTAFGLRTAATKNFTSDALGIPSSILIYLSPLLINAFAYMVLGRMVQFYLAEKKVFGIRAIRLTVIFVWLDVIAFLVQLVGATMTIPDTDANSTDQQKADSLKKQELGFNIYKGGIGFQLFWIVVFCVLAWRFRMKAVMEKVRGTWVARESNWKHLLAVLYLTLIMIMIRIIFRLIEFSGGVNSKLTTTEGFFYGLEATPMALACITWNVFHPGRYLVGPESEFPRLTRKEKKALKAEKKAEKQEKKREKQEEKDRKKQWKLETKMMVRSGDLEMGNREPLNSPTQREDRI
ncbi:hypothetical protein H072_10932 [Dactylellina haptotyla CBS 200.50]|uniref:RTA1 domain protein n=1 Tax=Dactylellina haptotyla (strain CBS 200.50) TaxID=1284197 RepID=S8BK62_DACHA|nr:hypothetical protein H072_10932 [Dactylellina haptotyla CBS 200.50]